ncbi:putative endoplasmic reticulum metallopeptidase 1-B [Nymphaea thermarum]|nr:putative endoplasmic reticulum metallopeptidase 1-B [Nymphaea thermarum]
MAMSSAVSPYPYPKWDVFPIIPGDTDYRIFAEDYGDIPGLDIIFVLGGYFYHTSYDTVERLFPGSIQARGENLFSLVKAFTSSSKLQTAMQRKLLRVGQNETIEEQAVFFDYLSLFMVFYSGKTVVVLHSLPMIMFLSMPFFLSHGDMRAEGFFSVFCQLFKGMLFHVFGVLLAVIVPVVFAICRLLFSGYAMSWFAHPWLAFLMFIPSSLIGLLIPRIISSDLSSRATSASKSSTMVHMHIIHKDLLSAISY